MIDTFHSYTSSLESPAERHFNVTPSDVDDLPVRPRALRIGSAGVVVLRDEAGQDVSYGVAAGEILTFRAIQVRATGTTAGDIVGWY